MLDTVTVTANAARTRIEHLRVLLSDPLAGGANAAAALETLHALDQDLAALAEYAAQQAPATVPAGAEAAVPSAQTEPAATHVVDIGVGDSGATVQEKPS